MAELLWCNQPCVELLGFPAAWEHAAWPCLGYGMVRSCNASQKPTQYGLPASCAIAMYNSSGDSSMHKCRVWIEKMHIQIQIFQFHPEYSCNLFAQSLWHNLEILSTPMGCILALQFCKKHLIFFTWTPRCVQVAMPRARRAAGSWAVQASLMSRHPGHVSISMRKGPAICMLNQWMTMLDRNILNLEWCCSILSGPKNRTVPVCGHAFDIQPCGPSSTCSSTEGLGLKLYWSCVPSSLLKNNVIPLISSNSP